MDYGFVYVLRNECMPGIFKIGYTDRSPLKRCAEVSGSTGIPIGFDLVCYGEKYDAASLEKELHEMFSHRRINAGREFFRLDYSNLMVLANEIEGSCDNFTSCSGLIAEEAIDYRKNFITYKEKAINHFISDGDVDGSFHHCWYEDNESGVSDQEAPF